MNIEDLNRDELIILIRRTAILRPSDRDIVCAVWEAACNRARAAWDAVMRSCDEVKPLALAVDRARTPAGKTKALAAYQTAITAGYALEARAERLQRRADNLYKQLESLPR